MNTEQSDRLKACTLPICSKALCTQPRSWMQPGSLPLSCIVSSAMVRFFWCMGRRKPITEEQTVIRTECATCTVLCILRRVQSKRQRYERCRGRVAIGGHMALVTTHARVLWGLGHRLSHVRHSARPSLKSQTALSPPAVHDLSSTRSLYPADSEKQGP